LGREANCSRAFAACFVSSGDAPAALAARIWGAELIGLGSDTINLRVSRKPGTREEALELARAQYVYCNDIIDQGVGSYRELAAGLMASDWWFFWWD
jgi:hypothetical protein